MQKKRFASIKQTLASLCLAMVFVVCIPTVSSQAQPLGIPEGGSADGLTGCATDTWVAMVNQSVLEARRENIMHQRYIAKADSVLTYSCFSEDLVPLVNDIGPIFSETDAFARPDIPLSNGYQAQTETFLGFDSLDNSITLGVVNALTPYLDNNFDHGLYGELAPVIPPTSVPCTVMNNVWSAAVCNNIMLVDEFYEFEDLVAFDPRIYPTGEKWQCIP